MADRSGRTWAAARSGKQPAGLRLLPTGLGKRAYGPRPSLFGLGQVESTSDSAGFGNYTDSNQLLPVIALLPAAFGGAELSALDFMDVVEEA